MPSVRALQRHILVYLLSGAVLSLTLLLRGVAPTQAQQPEVTSSAQQVAAAVWQEVPFEAQLFLQLQPGWYRLQNSSIYFVVYPDMASMARGLDRLAYFVEKAQTKGIIVHRDRIRGNVFYGHDYSLIDVARFFSDMRRHRSRQEIFPEERALRERLLRQGLLVADRRGQYTGKAHTALLGFAQAAAYPANTSPTPLNIYLHEMFHGIWFTTAYRQEVAEYWQRLPAEEQQTIIDILHQRAQYDPQNMPLIQREFASYFRDYQAQAVLSSSRAQTLGIAKLEAYQQALRKIEQPYIRSLGGTPTAD